MMDLHTNVPDTKTLFKDKGKTTGLVQHKFEVFSECKKGHRGTKILKKFGTFETACYFLTHTEKNHLIYKYGVRRT